MKSIVISFMMMISLSAAAGLGKDPIHWGKVSESEFSIVPAGKDANAPAIVLCDFGDIEITNRTFYTRHTRIRILNEEGLKYAMMEIPYETRYKHDSFYEIKAMTILLENGKITEFHVQQGGFEDIRINDRWSKKKFIFPNVKPGAIIEFRYTIASLDFEKLDTWYFQREIPTLWSELRFDLPSPFVYLVTFENNRSLDAGEESVYGEKLQWLYNTRAWTRSRNLAQNRYLLYNTPENRFKVWALNNVRKKIVMKNLPGMASTGDGAPVAEIYPQVKFNLFESSGNLPRSFRPLMLTTHEDYETRGEWELMDDPMAISGYVHYKMKTWSQVNDNLLKHERFGQYLAKNRGGNQLIDSITGKSNDPRVRTKALYDFVKSNFKWNGEFSVYASQDLDDFLRSRTGASADVNLMLVNMLRRAGIEAYPLLIRTAGLGKPEKMYPVKDQFNHVIVLAEIQGKQVILDATGDNADLGMLNKSDIGTLGWIVREENPGWIEIFTPEVKQDKDDGLLFNL